MMRSLSATAALLLLSACSSILSGTSQEIAVNTDPNGAHCSLQREGVVIAEVPSTPGAVKVQKTKHDITILCDKDGYQQAAYRNKSGVDGMTLGNIVAGGLVGWGIDSATGADNKYDGTVNLRLVPLAAPTPVPPPPAVTVDPPRPPTS